MKDLKISFVLIADGDLITMRLHDLNYGFLSDGSQFVQIVMTQELARKLAQKINRLADAMEYDEYYQRVC